MTKKMSSHKIKLHQSYSPSEAFDAFREAGKNCDLITIKSLFQHSKLNSVTSLQLEINQAFISAVYAYDFPLIQYLLTSNDILCHAQVDYDDSSVLSICCSIGHIELLRYFLTSSDLANTLTITGHENNTLFTACEYGHLDIVHYLLTSPELKTHPSIHYDDDRLFMMACQNGHLDIARYLLFSPELKTHITFDYSDLTLFYSLLDNHHHIIHFLIFECGFVRTNPLSYLINMHFKGEPNPIDDMFALKELNTSLNKDLPVHHDHSMFSHKLKI